MLNLSRIYTTHCVRATCIRMLNKAGFANRDICKVSGHNNESTLSSYTGRVCNEKKMAMSDCDTISRALGGQQVVVRSTPAATMNMPPEMDQNQALVPPSYAVESEEFDINFDLGVSSPQLSIQVCSVSEVIEEVEIAHNSSGSTIRNTTSSTSTTTR